VALVIYPIVSSKVSVLAKVGIAVLNVAVLGAAKKHVSDFWKGKAKLPLPKVGDYNDAIGITQGVNLNTRYLIASWVLVGVLGLVL